MSSCNCCAGGTSIEHAFTGDEVLPLAGPVHSALHTFLGMQTNLTAQITAIEAKLDAKEREFNRYFSTKTPTLADKNEMTSMRYEIQVLQRKKIDSVHKFAKVYMEHQPNVMTRDFTSFGFPASQKSESAVEESLAKVMNARSAPRSVVSDPDFAAWTEA